MLRLIAFRHDTRGGKTLQTIQNYGVQTTGSILVRVAVACDLRTVVETIPHRLPYPHDPFARTRHVPIGTDLYTVPKFINTSLALKPVKFGAKMVDSNSNACCERRYHASLVVEQQQAFRETVSLGRNPSRQRLSHDHTPIGRAIDFRACLFYVLA